MATVDSLDIRISAQANSASESIDKLVGKLNTLSTSLGKINTSGLTKLSDNAKKLSSINFSNFKNGLNDTSSVMNKVSRNSKNLALSFGRLYLAVRTLEKGAKALWGSIESSMDYVEVLNYFDAAFDQVAQKADLSAFEQLGYDSAEEYAKSFSERAKQLTAQMTGFAVTDKGTLEATGMPSLGLNPSQLMQYQAMFGQMASSMGVASETSLKLSRALTEIGADLASVKNMDFDKVWTDMASGLAGMSRTLDKYGVNIRNVNLQQKLTELGINANIQALNQNDKALLRTIILLDSTRYAWGDLADTINQPANQLRLINANFQNLGRTIGNLFLPLVQKVLPYINALVIALQRLFTWVGNLLGIDISKVTSSVGETDFSGLIEDTDDLTGGLNNATKAAEKLKKGIRGFDELEVINTKDESGAGAGANGKLSSGLLDAALEDILSEYQTAWDKAFANMENRAQEMADKVEKVFEPIKKIIKDFAIGDFFQAGKDTSNLIAGIFDFFANAIDNVDWEKLGQNIGEFIEGIDWVKVISSAFKLRFNIWKAIAEVWFESFNTAPIETTIITAIGLLKFTNLGNIVAPKIAKAIMGTKLISEITTAWASLGGLGGILTADLATVMGAGTLTEIGMTIGVGIIGGIAATFAGFNAGKELGKWFNPEDAEWYDNFTWFGENGFFETVTDDFKISWDALNDMASDTSTPFNAFVSTITSMIFPLNGLIGKIQNLGDSFGSVSDKAYELGSSLSIFYSESINNITDFITKILLKIEELKGKISQKFEEFKTIVGEKMSAWYSKISLLFDENKWNFSGIKDGLSTAFNSAISSIKQIWNIFATWLNDKLNWNIEPISIAGKQIFDGATISLGKIPTYSTGGFPEDGWFRASRGEIMGKFDNGQSVVANNKQITDGIAIAVQNANSEQNALLREQNQLLRELLNKEFGITKEEIGKNAQSWARDYSRRTGREAYSF